MSRRVELHIEELVLHGFPPLDARAVGEAVERELAALMAERPPRARLAADAVRGGSFVAQSLAAGSLGAAIAGRIGGALDSTTQFRVGRTAH